VTQRTDTETQTLRAAINSALHEEFARDDDVVVMGEDVGEEGHVSNITQGLYEEFGDTRVRDAPLAEHGIVGAGVGAAATGLRPVVDLMYSDFAGVAFEQILNQMSKMHYMFGGKIELPMVVRASEGAGMNAAAQHSKTVHTLFGNLTGVKVVAPGTPGAAKGLTKAAIRSDDPVFFFENKMMYTNEGAVPTDDDYVAPIGEASVEVIDLRSIYPIDTDTLVDSVRKTGRLVVADESPLSHGTHGEIMARVNENAFFSLDAPMQRVGVPDIPVPFSRPLEGEIVPGTEELHTAIDRIV